MSCAYVELQPKYTIYAWAASEMLWWIIWTQFSGYKWLYYPLSSWAMENIIRRLLWIMGKVFYLSGFVVFSLLHVRVYRLYFIVQEHCAVSNLFYQQNGKKSTTLCRIFQNSTVQSHMHNEIREMMLGTYIFLICFFLFFIM